MKRILIVGQGIAGTVLGCKLLWMGYDVTVIDHEVPHQSSRVAAGIFNPIIGKRFTKTWLADELIPELYAFYEQFEKVYSCNLLHQMPSYIVFENAEHQNNWSAISKESSIAAYIEPQMVFPNLDNYIHQVYGGVASKFSGYVDTLQLLNIFRKDRLSNERLINETFTFGALEINKEEIIYKEAKYDSIVFCEGWMAIDNPLFPKLPFKLAKGELLTVEIPGFNPACIIHKGVYLCPLENDLFKVGATYNWVNLDPEPSNEARQWLETKLNAVLKVPYKVLEHKAGVRPTVADRRPLLGSHPMHSNVYIFNGLGTKGIMLAPYFAEQMIAFVENNTPLQPEADIRRFNNQG